MQAFASEDELRRYLKEISAKRQALMRMYAPAAKAASGEVAGVAVTVADGAVAVDGKDKESITNVQHAGVDEGGIVKLHGNQLVVLRRGRLFTVSIAGDALDPISSVDAFGPDINPSGTWYDEMLVSDDTVAVIGYSYQRGGTEVGLFHIDRHGNLA